MDMTVFWIILTIVVGLIIAGVIFNLYLYSSGAFSRRRWRSSRAMRMSVPTPKDVTEDQFSLSLGTPDKVMSNYVRRAFIIFCCLVLGLIVLVILILSAIH